LTLAYTAKTQSGFNYCHETQFFPFHRMHLRAWRFSTLDTQTPLTRVLPNPHPATTGVIKLSGSCMGASGIACAGIAMANAKTIAINLIICSSFEPVGIN